MIAALAAAAGAATQRGGPGAASGALLDLGLGFSAYGAVALALVFLLGDAPLRDAMRRLARRLARVGQRPAAPPP